MPTSRSRKPAKKAPKPRPSALLRSWAFARLELGLSEAEFWAATPAELRVLERQWRKREERTERRLATVIVGILRLGGDSTTTVDDLLRAPAKPASPADVEEQLACAFDFLRRVKQTA